ncbi:hypothetical protein HYH02_006968 [Chlamydomonas schloesseri]|uniref:Uncharacterized protein n=1 Tax=Chlamydomonas schloesseri TaxID=2026947 RepID=A0A836B5N3_9CHLO|nr:hypothetical protein HYH02_006968 [Chlamydomonas schloesseri]|eukprot:KAG2448386.1 hypothetical protein HYH02_006968 [Chlamydomonas schloesseri]
MNLVQTNLLHEVALEVKAQGGPAQFKAHALKNLELRTVLKESHGSPILDLVFNSVTPGHHNLFASIGKDQVTIYDDEHMGDYLGVVVHYVNSATGGDVSCCAWVQTAGISRHELGDACLAVSGPEGVIQVISVAEARVVALLKGHTSEVTELRGCAGVPGLLLSLGGDGGMRLWDVAAGACLAALNCADITTAELHPDGSCIYTGHRGGRVSRWPLRLERKEAAPASASASATTSPTPGASCFVPSPRLALAPGCAPAPVPLSLPANPPLGDYVDCIRVLPGGRLAAKSADGRLAAFDLAAGSSASGSGSGSGSDGTSGAAEAGAAAAAAAAAEAAVAEAEAGGSDGGAGGAKEGQEGAARQVLSLRVPGTHPASGGSRGGGQRCRFSVTRDGAFLCVGNSAGDVYVYDASTGGRAAHHPAHKVGGPARAAALSEDGRHLLVVRGNGYILRYEYIRKLDTGAAADPSSREVSPDPPGVEEAAAAGKRGAEGGEEGQRRVKGRAAAEAESEREGSADPEWSGGMEE